MEISQTIQKKITRQIKVVLYEYLAFNFVFQPVSLYKDKTMNVIFEVFLPV